MKWMWTSFVTTGMFFVRMLVLALMSILQLTVGGADIETRRSEAN